MLTRLALLAAAVVGLITTLHSTDQTPLIDIPARAKGAHSIVVATATSVTAGFRQTAFGDRIIVSEVGFQVEEVITGLPIGFALLDLEGGTVGDLTMRVSTLPTVEPGERAIVFLKGTSGGRYELHPKGRGILKLDPDDTVQGSWLKLDDVRRLVREVQQ